MAQVFQSGPHLMPGSWLEILIRVLADRISEPASRKDFLPESGQVSGQGGGWVWENWVYGALSAKAVNCQGCQNLQSQSQKQNQGRGPTQGDRT